MPQLVDTGVLFALADRSDAWHTRARTWVESSSETLLAPVTILAEVAYLLRTGPLVVLHAREAQIPHATLRNAERNRRARRVAPEDDEAERARVEPVGIDRREPHDRIRPALQDERIAVDRRREGRLRLIARVRA